MVETLIRPDQRTVTWSLRSSFVVLAVIIAVAAVLIAAWAPGGQQLRLVRRMTRRRREGRAEREHRKAFHLTN